MSITVNDIYGKRHIKSLGTRSKAIAELVLKDIDVKIARQSLDLGPTEKMNFDDFAKKFLNWYQVQNSIKSYQDYRNLFTSTIIPYFSKTKLNDITIERIETYKFERIKKISSSTAVVNKNSGNLISSLSELAEEKAQVSK